MKITDVSYSRKVNLGNYESEDYSISGVVVEGEDVIAQFQLLKDFVNASAFGKPMPEVVTQNPVKKEDKVEVTTTVTTTEVVTVEEPKKRTRRTKEQMAEDALAPKDVKIAQDDKLAKETHKEEKAKEEASQGDVDNYDRDRTDHKAQFVTIVNSKCKDWKKIAPTKVKDLSIELDGTPLYNNNILLPSFIEAVELGLKKCGLIS